VLDSGAHLFLNGAFYYRQIDGLSINISVAKVITNEGWQRYLAGSLALAKQLGRSPNLSMITFQGAFPNAVQRKMAAEFVERADVRPLDRVALLTESQVLRSAMTAFAWVAPKLRFRAFAPSDRDACYRWLNEVGTFDEALAEGAWLEGAAQLDRALSR
jgi:hypothetical protein